MIPTLVRSMAYDPPITVGSRWRSKSGIHEGLPVVVTACNEHSVSCKVLKGGASSKNRGNKPWHIGRAVFLQRYEREAESGGRDPHGSHLSTALLPTGTLYAAAATGAVLEMTPEELQRMRMESAVRSVVDPTAVPLDIAIEVKKPEAKPPRLGDYAIERRTSRPRIIRPPTREMPMTATAELTPSQQAARRQFQEQYDKLTPEQRQEIAELRRQGEDISEIQRTYHVMAGTVGMIVREFGVKAPKMLGTRGPRSRKSAESTNGVASVKRASVETFNVEPRTGEKLGRAVAAAEQGIPMNYVVGGSLTSVWGSDLMAMKPHGTETPSYQYRVRVLAMRPVEVEETVAAGSFEDALKAARQITGVDDVLSVERVQSA